MELESKLLSVATYVRLRIEHKNKDKNPELYGECVDASMNCLNFLARLAACFSF